MDREFLDLLMKFVEQFLLIVIPVIVPGIIVFVFAKASEAWVTAQRWNSGVTTVLEQAAAFAVKAAEQTNSAAILKGKKEYALSVAQEYLKANKVNIDLFLLDAAIEQAVYEYINKNKIIQAEQISIDAKSM